MQRYVVSSLGRALLVLFGCLVLVFFMIRVSGDPCVLLLPREATLAQIEAFRNEMGFNRPLLVQFLDYTGGVLTGDLGRSMHYRLPALLLIRERIPATLELAIVAIFIAVGIAVPLGLVGGMNPGSRVDWTCRFVGLLGQSTPSYWVGMVMIVVFAVGLGWFPASGRDSPRSVIMPAFALAIPTLGRLVRLTRSAVLEITGEDYVRTAHSKGLPLSAVYVRHVLRNAAIPLVTLVGVQFGYMLTGSLIIETIFAWPGLGRLLYLAVNARDFALVQAIALFSGIVVVLAYFLTDVAYVIIDPRVRYE
jgi:ABC-type dipeptide/oligopeptide/nickel transport system permease component